MTVDASKMDLNFIDVKKLSKGKSITVQTWNSGLKQGLVYGGITIQYLENNKIKISPDKYDFDIRPWNSIKEYFRNVETFGAGILHGNGTPFYIHFKGINTVRRKNHLFYKLIL